MSPDVGTVAEPVRVELLDDGRLARIVLAAGKGNVVDSDAIEALGEAFAELHARPELCGIVLDHEGRHFSFGASVEEHAPERVDAFLRLFHGLVRDLLESDVPLLVAVRGLCLGGGLELALLGDLIFCAPDARLGQPEIQLGVFAPVGSALLPERIGSERAADLLLSGRQVDAAEARAIGLVSHVAEDPAATALAWAREHLLTKSAAALRFARRAACAPWRERAVRTIAELERIYLEELMATQDAPEGIAAFLERREPTWRDR